MMFLIGILLHGGNERPCIVYSAVSSSSWAGIGESIETGIDILAQSVVSSSIVNYLFGHRHLHRHGRLHHDGHGRLSSRGPDHQGFESGRGRAYHSLAHVDRPCAENSLGGGEGLWSALDEENGHDDLEVGRGRLVQNRSATRQKEEYEPTKQL